jgi:hypothetical protein
VGTVVPQEANVIFPGGLVYVGLGSGLTVITREWLIVLPQTSVNVHVSV